MNMKGISFLSALIMLLCGVNAAAADIEDEILGEMNAARGCPSCYAKQALEPYRAAFTGMIAKRPSGNLRTEEGVRAVNDAIADLTRKQPVGLLKLSAGLTRAAADHVRDINASGVPGRGHRRNIFNPDLAVAGIACAPHKVYSTVCVIDFAGSFVAAPSPDPK